MHNNSNHFAAGTTHSLYEGNNFIGKLSNKVDVLVVEDSISDLHANIKMTAETQFVEDLRHPFI
jgi:hypothetical protein